MWTPEDFPGADNVPWQLLIRARFAHEIDAVIASTIVRQVGRSLDVKSAVTLAEKAGVRHATEPATAEQKVGVLSLMADWDGDLCPPPFKWPPKKRGLEDLRDPISVIGLERAIELVGLGSKGLQESLGGALEQVAGGLG